MSPEPPDTPRTAAIEQLQQFGLSAYASRTYVALTSLGTGTAKDVSRVSDVPRTRVYDAIDELHGRGLVDIQQSSPKEFWPSSAETTVRAFEREMDHRTRTLAEALEELEPTKRSNSQKGVWTVDGRSAVTDRVLEFLQSAENEIVYMSVEELLTDVVVDELSAAAERGVDIKLGGVSSAVQTQIRDRVPDADIFESLWVWSDTPAGRLMLVDETQTLASVLLDDADGNGTEERSETAIWGTGETNSLVVVLRAIFTWRLRGPEN